MSEEIKHVTGNKEGYPAVDLSSAPEVEQEMDPKEGLRRLRQLAEALLEEEAVPAVLETMDLDEAIWTLRKCVLQRLQKNGVGQEASATHMDKSEKTLSRYGAPEAGLQVGGRRGFALLEGVLKFFVEHREGATAGQCLGAIADEFPNVSQQNLKELLSLYCKMGYLERERETFRIRDVFLKSDWTQMAERLAFLELMVQRLWPILKGFLLGEPGANVKRIAFFGTQEEFDTFLEALREFLVSYMARGAASTTGDGQDHRRRWFEVFLGTVRIEGKPTSAGPVSGLQSIVCGSDLES